MIQKGETVNMFVIPEGDINLFSIKTIEFVTFSYLYTR